MRQLGPPPRQQYRRQVVHQPVKPAPRPTLGFMPRVVLPRSPLTLALIGGVGAVVLTLSSILALIVAMLLVSSSGRVLPGVVVGGVALGGLSREDAVARLAVSLTDVTLRDGDRAWQIPASQIGIAFDAAATADAAVRYGRGEGSLVQGVIGRVEIMPAMRVDVAQAMRGLESISGAVDLPARNATIRMENNELVPVAAEMGRKLNTQATAARLAAIASGTELMNQGGIDLVMETTYPTVTDATPLLERTRALLASPLTINAYNPVTNESRALSISPAEWGQWLTTENDASQGLRLSLDGGALTNYLNAQNMGADRFLKVPEAVKVVQDAIAAGTPNATIRVYNAPTKYTVLPGDTLGTISWKVGIQMFRIQRANPGVNLEALFPGQSITIPSKDELLPLPIVPNKRIVVSISQQRMLVYENGQVKWDWPVSTGIPSSPTMPGVYQVTSHDGTAYASVWNLYMPYFMSIYEAVPGFYNGIHGFPSRGGSQLLWENALGGRVTYGCVLISTANAVELYKWAANGVVTEIQP